jgi:hypothetical protein
MPRWQSTGLELIQHCGSTTCSFSPPSLTWFVEVALLDITEDATS